MGDHPKYFKGQLENEEVIAHFRQHWVVIIAQIIYMLLMMSLLTLMFFNGKSIANFIHAHPLSTPFFFTGYVIFAAFFHKTFITILNHFVNVVLITDRRIIHYKKTLFFQNIVETIDMAQIQDIQHDLSGIMPNILKYGKIHIIIASTISTKTFKYVPNGKYYFRTICTMKNKLGPVRHHSNQVSGAHGVTTVTPQHVPNQASVPRQAQPEALHVQPQTSQVEAAVNSALRSVHPNL